MRLHCLTACLLAAAPIVAAIVSPFAASQASPDIATPASSAVAVGITVVLRSPHEDQLRAYAAAVSHPANNRYRHLLTPAELRQHFGAPAVAVARVTAWARTAGMQVGPIDATGTRLPVTAKASTVRRALGVTLYELYDRMTDGVWVRSASVLRLPARVAADIAAVTDLGQHPAVAMHARLAAVFNARSANATTVADLQHAAAAWIPPTVVPPPTWPAIWPAWSALIEQTRLAALAGTRSPGWAHQDELF